MPGPPSTGLRRRHFGAHHSLVLSSARAAHRLASAQLVAGSRADLLACDSTSVPSKSNRTAPRVATPLGEERRVSSGVFAANGDGNLPGPVVLKRCGVTG